MVDCATWDSRPEWLPWVIETWEPGRGRVQQQYAAKPDHPARASFAAAAASAFESRGVPVVNLKTWVSIQLPEDGDGYAVDYPHVHHPLDGQTLVHYLQAEEGSAELDIFDEDEVVETIRPTPGMTVFMPNNLRHGVRKHHGALPRIQLIATALPR